MTPTRALLHSINKLKECLACTTAALAPYPVTAICTKKVKKNNEKEKKSDSKNI